VVSTTGDDGVNALYIISGDGSNMKNLVTISAHCYTLSWSLDCTYLVFVQGESYENEKIYSVHSNGTNLLELTDGQDFVCSPHENKICFTKMGDYPEYGWEIYRMNMDGTNIEPLTASRLQKSGLLWLPESEEILFTLNDNINGTFENIYKLNLNDKSTELVVDTYESPLVTDYSASRNTLIFTSGAADIFKMDLLSHEVVQLTFTDRRDEKGKISASGDQIVFESGREGRTQIYLMNFDGSDQKNISQSNDYDYHPQWSPDGLKIAYMSVPPGDYNFKIHIMNADGSQNQELNIKNKLVNSFCWYPIIGNTEN
jgi:TolB protein